MSERLHTDCRRCAHTRIGLQSQKLIAFQRAGFKAMQPCSGTNNSITWCCGYSTDCCNNATLQDQVVTLVAKFLAEPTSSSSSSVASSTSSVTSSVVRTVSTSTSTTTTSPAASIGSAATTETPTPDGGLSTGAKAGIGVGAALGAILLVGLGIWIAKMMNKRKEAQAQAAYHNPDVEGYYGQHPQKYAYYAEADAVTAPLEIPSPDPVEMPTNQSQPVSSKLGYSSRT